LHSEESHFITHTQKGTVIFVPVPIYSAIEAYRGYIYIKYHELFTLAPVGSEWSGYRGSKEKSSCPYWGKNSSPVTQHSDTEWTILPPIHIKKINFGLTKMLVPSSVIFFCN